MIINEGNRTENEGERVRLRNNGGRQQQGEGTGKGASGAGNVKTMTGRRMHCAMRKTSISNFEINLNDQG